MEFYDLGQQTLEKFHCSHVMAFYSALRKIYSDR